MVPLEELLNTRELTAYRAYMRLNQPPMSPKLQAELYNLFLQGHSCESIASINHQFGNASLGMIIRARLENEWDKKRQEYVQDLMENIGSKVKQTTMESANFVSDMMAAINKYYGSRYRKYIQTGNEEDLDGIELPSMTFYPKVVEMLLKLTGQDNNKRQIIDGVVEHRHTLSSDSIPKPVSPEEAALIIKTIDATNKK